MPKLGTLIFLLAFIFLAATRPEAAEAPVQESRIIQSVRVSGVINPVVAEFIEDRIEAGNQAGATGFLIEIDTPGGLDTAMRQIIQAILGSRIPVIVYVSPSGARAASAGALITLAADFAAMAPGTNIGAAHPVAIGAGKEEADPVMTAKVVNDAVAYARGIAGQRGRNVEWAEKLVRESKSVPADEALEHRIIDLVAPDRDALLKRLDGRKYRRGAEELQLLTAGAAIETAEMNWRQRILDILSNPTVAYMLLMLGILGIFFEISQPGVILPGAIGGIALLLALYAFQTLPINYAGVLLILLALVLFILEIKVASYGMLTVGGIVALSLGSLMLIDSSVPYLQISRAVIAATVFVCSAFFTLVLFYVVRTHRTRFVSGSEGMTGERGTAVTAIDGGGRVFVHGEYWDAWSREPLPAGETVEIVRVEPGLRLEVRRALPPHAHIGR